jgi:hypothetical protein
MAEDLLFQPEEGVDMNKCSYVKGNGKLFTNALNGCNAIVIYTNNDGYKQGILAHYDPTHESTEICVNKIGEFVNQLMKEADSKHTVIVHEEFTNYKQETKDYLNKTLSILEDEIHRCVGNETQIRKLSYERGKDLEAERYVYLLLEEGSWGMHFEDGPQLEEKFE